MSTNNRPHPVFLAANENRLIRPEYREMADALIAAQQCARTPALRESLQNAIAIFTSQEAPLPPYVLVLPPVWMQNILPLARQLTQASQNKAPRETLAFDEEGLLSRLRFFALELNELNRHNFVRYRSQRASTEHLTVKHATLYQFAAPDSQITVFTRFRTYATPEEIRVFFFNFLQAARRISGLMGPFPHPIHAVPCFLRACVRIHDDAFRLSGAYANPHTTRYIAATAIHPHYIGVFLKHLAAHGEREGLEEQRRRTFAFAMGTHPRLGAGSPVRILDGYGDLMRLVLRGFV